jgi:DNA-directed RNA polymerase subunit RPC12/RpoP
MAAETDARWLYTCAQCNYTLHGLTLDGDQSVVCPECGRRQQLRCISGLMPFPRAKRVCWWMAWPMLSFLCAGILVLIADWSLSWAFQGQFYPWLILGGIVAGGAAPILVYVKLRTGYMPPRDAHLWVLILLVGGWCLNAVLSLIVYLALIAAAALVAS